MANRKQLKILKEGVEAWNEWRDKNRGTKPDLSAASLFDRDLSGADLSDADLTRANLSGANLSGAKLLDAILLHTSLASADLRGASLLRAKVVRAELTRANLSGANLRGAVFSGALLADVDLSEAKGLESVDHYGASTIGIDTLYKSQGEIPDEFLRDAGVPEEIIDVARSIRNGPTIQWHSCFISYSTRDEDFARRLRSRMREANMRVFIAPEDLEGGKKLHEQLFNAIQLQDRLLLVLSSHSVQSEWVMTEIRMAREVEKKENRRKLFPIRLVDLDVLRAWSCFDADSGKDLAVEVREYFTPDFSNWKDPDVFEEAFKRLQKDLKAGQPQITSL